MRILVTGGLGGVGRAVVRTLQDARHDVTATDLVRPRYDDELEANYLQADLVDPGEATWVTRGHDVVVHCAAIPEPTRNAPSTVWRNNVVSTFNVVEGAVLGGARRLVNLSSETVLGFQYAQRPFLPERLPVDETTPTRPQDPYALSKLAGEQIVAAAVDGHPQLSSLSLRPSWVQYPDTYERNLGLQIRDPNMRSANLWAYVDSSDLADAVRRACEVDMQGHEAMFVVNPDVAGPLPLADLVRRNFPGLADDVEIPAGEEIAPVMCAKARQILGWTARRSWRDHVTP